MSYRNAISYLATKTEVLELFNQLGARLVVCPDWNGRVMTSTCDGIDGSSFGFINVKDIATVEPDSPAAGKISFGGEEQLVPLVDDLDNACLDGPFRIEDTTGRFEIRLKRDIQGVNNAGQKIDLQVSRCVNLLNHAGIDANFGDIMARVLAQEDLSYVAFATTSSVTNISEGPTESDDAPSVSVTACLRSMFNANPYSVAVLPFRQGSEEEPPIHVEYFGNAPHGRFRHVPGAALLRADGKIRFQIGVASDRAQPLVGAVDFREGILTLIAFDMPEKADWAAVEMSYDGDVVRAYNYGVTQPNEVMPGSFYGFDINTPAITLAGGETLTHDQYTLHVNADKETLSLLAQELLGIDYMQAYRKIMTL